VNTQDGPAPNVDVLWCDRCGRPGVVRHRALGDVRAAYELFCEQERDGPDARLFGMGDYYDGPPLDRAGYEAAVDGLVRRCRCGGAFRFTPAPATQPTSEQREGAFVKKNNIDMAVLGGVVERGRTDPGVFRMHKRIEGTWSFAEGMPAFTTTVAHGDRTTELAVDIAPGFGGAGLAPDPLQYMLAGLGACYAATVVTIAAMEGVGLTELRVVAEQDVDVSRVYEMGDGPLMEQISVTVKIGGDFDDDTLARWQQAAREKCPFAFTVINPVPLRTRVERM
jgi:uncharacterized OsmC-like protein